MASRYDNLTTALDDLRLGGKLTHLRFLEVGTYDGVRASTLIRRWLGFGDKFTAEYHGFDLFEFLTPQMSKQELSKSKLPPSSVEVMKRMAQLPRTSVKLYKGNTRETLPKQAEELPPMSLIFVDGGHSLETIESDWNAVKQLMDVGTITLFDDYYENRDDYGCKALVHGLDPRYRMLLCDPVDHIEHNNLRIRMARVTL